MLTALLVIFLLVLAVVFFLWLIRSMMSASCPDCMKENGTEEIIIPIIPGFRWFCPRCQGVFPHSEITGQAENSNTDEEE